MVRWDEEWEAAQPAHLQQARKRARLGQMGTLALVVTGLLGLMVGGTRLRGLGHQGGAAASVLQAGPQDRESARFTLCRGGSIAACVVDGDTIWYRGVKIRVLDINAPEISHPQCNSEEDLGLKARDRLQALLNAGPFTLESRGARDADRYGRKLRAITRGGRSLGAVLVDEGLAEEWTGRRRNWC